MGKLHKIRRQIMRDPTNGIIGKAPHYESATKAYQNENGIWEPYFSAWSHNTGSYGRFIKSVFKKAAVGRNKEGHEKVFWPHELRSQNADTG